MSSDNLQFNVKPSAFNKKLKVPTSKSYANRLLILAALDRNSVTLEDLPDSTDVLTMIDCLKEVGLDIEINGKNATIKNSFPECEGGKEFLELFTGDGGTTNRFLLAFLARGKTRYRLSPKGHMRKRPMDDLVFPLRDLGCEVVYGGEEFWIDIKGPLPKEGKCGVNCSQSTQFATALALALADSSVEISLRNLDASRKYFELTEKLVGSFRTSVIDYKVPPDFSGLGYPLALGCIGGEVQVKNCSSPDPYQADSEFLTILSEMGVQLDWSSEGLIVKKPDVLKGIDRDGSMFPDLVPTLAFVCAYASGPSVLRNLEILRHKECDRVEETLKILDLFEVPHQFDEKTHTLIIQGNSPKVGEKEYQPPEDHRMVMVAYLFMRMNNGGRISNTQAVKKSFPDFFDVMED